MLRLKSKKEVLQEYESRYPELDNYFMNELSKEYDRYAELLKDCETKEEAYKIFSKEIKENEKRYRDNAMLNGLEASLDGQFMEILAQYGLIKFFKDNILDD
ncbi:hypothetical protein FYJ27_03240 [Anaerosalibacter bizertensis]|uniref:Uncharacterized protein n=1 Tax=Anaerosalibacter bizertensis TaxID=932217 RepID=A0A844FFF8_9FIRM|nr:hypothetical protein [Anaerosalibacter bizertensis]MBU5293612.1 hypothetical protein [Anaerosalibacter bizertensis]MSS42747.1 hypothetical protein [Anaerosalibacter bizertensis]HHV27465.1 hypothetical protein [Tissierellia bacterium]